MADAIKTKRWPKGKGLDPKKLKVRKRRYYDKHKTHCLDKGHKWYKDNIDRAGDAAYWRSIKRNYGLTKSAYCTMLDQQRGVCKLCFQPNGTWRLGVDHDHITRKVRGLLCQGCNALLGRIECNPGWLERVKEYLNG